MSRASFLTSITGRPRHATSIVFGVVRSAAARHGVDWQQIYGPKRGADLCLARDEACHDLRDMGMAYAKIGRMLNRDHSTIISAVARHRSRITRGDAA
ncbi:helix-turn-helix domain-containing protein [Frigidibacter sp. MR17.24]|uniref:helix-turn-helix domain-containing protein n=1 Tax=Frigidibacter sp. MR17.24 TaxID=3127345 RepID=UPI003012FCF6